MMQQSKRKTPSHGGLLFPLDMFRPTMLAAALAENLLGKARNILDARLVMTRHSASPMVLAQIEGSVIGDDPAGFWRDNPDLAMYASQVLPRQVFLYHAQGGADRREGFLVAQRGQAIAGDDSEQDGLPATSPDKVWPVARLCEQMRITLAELAGGFEGGFRVELSLMEPTGDDETIIMTLAGRAPAGEDDEDIADDDGDRPAPEAKPKKITAAEDEKRRAAQRAAEAKKLEERSESATRDLPYVIDDVGLVAAPKAELSETGILAGYLTPALTDALPPGLPAKLRDPLHGKPIDFAVRVEFLSEVFVDNTPLSRPTFEAKAEDATLAGVSVKRLEVLAPRLGVGTLLRKDRAMVFISRRAGAPLPEVFLLELLEGS